jgi:hypothetical protein
MAYNVAKNYFPNYASGFRVEFFEFTCIRGIKIGSDAMCK